MGLDLVELVLRTEEVFGITLSNEDAEQSHTVGDLYRQVLTSLDLPYEPARSRDLSDPPSSRVTPWGDHWNASEVWSTLHYIVLDQLQVDSEEVHENADFRTDLGAD